jgi:hypothetical protein
MILVLIDLGISGNIFQIRCLRDAEIWFPHVETMLWLAIAFVCCFSFPGRPAVPPLCQVFSTSKRLVPGLRHKSTLSRTSFRNRKTNNCNLEWFAALSLGHQSFHQPTWVERALISECLAYLLSTMTPLCFLGFSLPCFTVVCFATDSQTRLNS